MNNTTLIQYQADTQVKNTASLADESAFDLAELSRIQPQNIDRNTYSASYALNRCATKKSGIIGQAILKERNELRELLKTKDYDPSFICMIPNSKLPWFNKAIKSAIAGKTSGLTRCDYNYISNFWMDAQALKDMLAFCSGFIDNTKDGFSVPPPKTRQGLELKCSNGIVGANFRNPGFVAADSNSYYNNEPTALAIYKPKQKCTDCSEQDTKVFDQNDLLKMFKKFYTEANYDFDEGDNPFYNEYSTNDSAFYKHLRLMADHLHGDIWDLNFIMKLSNMLNQENKKQANMYLLTLINPWLKLQVGVPSAGYAPTAKFQITNKYTLATNNTGNAAWAFNPFFINTGGSTIFGFNNNVALTGSGSSNFFLGYNVGQSLPIALYSRYRLVSAGINVRYVGSSLNASGYITQGVDYGVNVGGVSVGTAIPNFQQYGSFSTVDNCYFTQTTANNSDRSNTVIWAPDDFNAQNFQDVGTSYNDAPVLVGYCSGAQPSASVIELSIALNVEAIVSNAYTDYLPSTIYKGHFSDLQEAQSFMSIVSSDSNVPMAEIISVVNEDNLKPVSDKTIENRTVPSLEDIGYFSTKNLPGVVKPRISLPMNQLLKSSPSESSDTMKLGLNQIPKMTTERMRSAKKQSFMDMIVKYLDWVSDLAPGWKYIKNIAKGKNVITETKDLVDTVTKIIGALGIVA